MTLIVANIFAQFNLTGKVVDNLGNPVVGANIAIENTFAGMATDASGKFQFRNLKSGDYQIKVSFIGFEMIQQTVKLAADVSLEINLKPSEILTDEVMVTATRAGEKTPMAYTTIEKEDLQQHNSGQDIPYLLSQIPSLITTSDAGAGVGYTGLRIRGTDPSRINVTINGIPFNDAESHLVYWVDMPDFASSVENVQVQRGVGTSTNGAGAFGATINFQTMGINKKPYVDLNNSYGSFNTSKNSITAGSGLLDDIFTLDVRLSKVHSDGYIDRAFSNLNSFFVSGGFYFKNQLLKINVFSGHEITYQAWDGMPKASLDTNRTYNPYTYNNQIDNYTQTNYQLIYSNQINRALTFNLALHYTKGYGYYEQLATGQNLSDYKLNNVIIGGDTIRQTDLISQKWLNNDFYGTTFSLQYHQKNIDLTFGGAANQYNGLHYGNVVWAQYINFAQKDFEWYNGTGKKSDYNAFAKLNLQVLKNLNLYADMQYRGINFDITGTDENNRDIAQTHQYSFFNPKLGAFLDINRQQNLFFSWAVAHREPTRDNLTDADIGKRPTYESLNDFELGYNLKTMAASVNINIFYMDYNNQLVETGAINDVGNAVMANVPASYRAGIEMSLNIHFNDMFFWSENITFSRNKIKNFTEFVPDTSVSGGQRSFYRGQTDISFSPTVILNSHFVFKPFHAFEIFWDAKHVNREYVDNTSSVDRSIDPYLVNNLGFSLNLKSKYFKESQFQFLINNVLNEKYVTNAWVYSYFDGGVRQTQDGYFPQAMRNFMVSWVLKF